MDLSSAKLTSYLVPALIIVIVLALRMRRMGQMRPLRVERLWIVPAIYAIVLALALKDAPPSVSDAPWLVGAAVVGAVIGWYRGKSMQIIVDPATHAINQVASPLAMVFLIVVIGLRYGIRYFLAGEAATWRISINILSDVPLFLGCAMFITTRLEMFLRARRLLAEAKTTVF